MSLFTLFSLLLMSPVLFAAFFQKYRVSLILREEVDRLQLRRAKRAKQAFTEPVSPEWDCPDQTPKYSFSSWVEFLDNGSIKVAGECFSLKQPFQVIARDKRNISRANVTCLGNGEAIINSHGLVHRVRFSGYQWQIELVDTLL